MARKRRGGPTAPYRSAAAVSGQLETVVNPTQAGFSLADEARNTTEHRKHWDQERRLRDFPVVFVSAGIIEPLKDLESLDYDAIQTDPAHNAEQGTGGALCTEDPRALGHRETSALIDATGDRRPCHFHGQATRIPACISDDETSSSEDVVLFKGRKTAHADNAAPPAADDVTKEVEAAKTVARTYSNTVKRTEVSASCPSAPNLWQPHAYDDQDAILADYIANMFDNDMVGTAGDSTSTRVFYHSTNSQRREGDSDGEISIADDSDVNVSESLDTTDHKILNAWENYRPTTSGGTGITDEVLSRLLTEKDALGSDVDEATPLAGNGPSSWSMSRKRRDKKLESDSESIAKTSLHRLEPSAAEVADAFDHLALMDWSRHNQSRKPKRQSAKPTFDISDSELEQTLQASWSADRLRKKERKKQREYLRYRGMLKKDVYSNQPREGHQFATSFDQVKEEMRLFLRGTDESLAFAPMGAFARKMIHELANKFNIKSKSAGHGETRRPFLYRTKGTLKYSEPFFEQVFARAGCRYFPRLSRNGKKPSCDAASKPERGSHAAFSLKEGEVVGGGAPELDQANKGRAMLEKMGWSTGMALGSHNNKGILQPLASVVKRTKAGLG